MAAEWTRYKNQEWEQFSNTTNIKTVSVAPDKFVYQLLLKWNALEKHPLYMINTPLLNYLSLSKWSQTTGLGKNFEFITTVHGSMSPQLYVEKGREDKQERWVAYLRGMQNGIWPADQALGTNENALKQLIDQCAAKPLNYTASDQIYRMLKGKWDLAKPEMSQLTKDLATFWIYTVPLLIGARDSKTTPVTTTTTSVDINAQLQTIKPCIFLTDEKRLEWWLRETPSHPEDQKADELDEGVSLAFQASSAARRRTSQRVLKARALDMSIHHHHRGVRLRK